ncbi:MAG: hypothetical protein INQ03_12590 [Candidatus Heimdallarchaeota archaeon]|nr:hypothetical protein [Candidatus Heimdallarchaeota archaeon]
MTEIKLLGHEIAFEYFREKYQLGLSDYVIVKDSIFGGWEVQLRGINQEYLPLASLLEHKERITTLELYFNYELRQLPLDLFELTNLNLLNLDFVMIDSLPDEVHQLKELMVLKIRSLGDMKSLNLDLNRLSNLRVLDFVGKATLSLSFDNLSNLSELSYQYEGEKEICLPDSLLRTNLDSVRISGNIQKNEVYEYLVK